jgi:predicted nucleic acid-binding protein
MEYQAGASASDPVLDAFPWLHVVPVHVAPALLDVLDLGEAATITLALAQHARVVLLDEQAGRRVATRYGLAVVGSLGVLVRAKQAGLLPLVRPHIDAMLAQGRRMSASLVLQTLQVVGEAP